MPANLKQEINSVFAQSVAEWDVVIDAAYTVEPSVLEKLDEGESGMLASFPKDMRDFIQTFKQARDEDKNAYYLFIIPGKQSTRAGFMPFKRQFGFIYPENTNNTARTIAHEWVMAPSGCAILSVRKASLQARNIRKNSQ